MNKIKALIVDDELAARNILENLLQLSCPDVEVLGKVENLESAVEFIKANEPDVVFLDVEMPRLAGYQIVNFFDEINFEIVFITAYNQYALKAFEVKAIDYILKPIERVKLVEAVAKVRDNITNKTANIKYKELLRELEVKEEKTIVVGEANQKHLVKLKDIIAVEAQGSYVYVYTKNTSKLTISKNIGYFEQELINDSSFFRTHKSWLINTKFINSYSKSKEEIQLQNSIVAKLSRFKKKDFEALIG